MSWGTFENESVVLSDPKGLMRVKVMKFVDFIIGVRTRERGIGWRLTIHLFQLRKDERVSKIFPLAIEGAVTIEVTEATITVASFVRS